MRVLVLVAVILGCASVVSACGGGGVDEGGREVERGAIHEGGGVIGNFGRGAGEVGHQGDEVIAKELDRFAREGAETSTYQLSEEAGISVNQSREVSCDLLASYEEGSVAPFVPWALDQLEVPVSRRFEIEGALEGLEEAIRKAEAGDGLGALVAGVCAP